MTDLKATSPCAGLAPTTIGRCTLSEVEQRTMTSIAPFRGAEAQVDALLKAGSGLGWPELNSSLMSDTARISWFSRGQAILIGVAADPALGAHAALTDQSDAWAVVRLEGEAAEAVLARHVPVDLRLQSFGIGATARTELAHMMASVTRVGPSAFEVMVFRSMARTLMHDLKSAMEAVAARG